MIYYLKKLSERNINGLTWKEIILGTVSNHQALQHKALVPVVQQAPSPQEFLSLSVQGLSQLPAQNGAVPTQRHLPTRPPVASKFIEVNLNQTKFSKVFFLSYRYLTKFSTWRQNQHTQENGNNEFCEHFLLNCSKLCSGKNVITNPRKAIYVRLQNE